MLRVLNQAFDNPLKLEERASMPFAGGIMQHGYQCGMIWGAAIAAGAQAYRLHGPGSKAQALAIIAAERIVASFRERNQEINCYEITELNRSSSTTQMIMYFLIKGGTIGCFRMAAGYAPIAYREINSALSEKDFQVPSPPLSCAAMLAKKMGVSEMQTLMAAGLAGGIGLCGGACGALGTAIWIMSLKNGKGKEGRLDFNNPRALAAIENFLKYSNYEFECYDIVGRKFKNIDDHAAYLRDGGCSEIIESLASDRD